ncbi:MAG TPA: hypothetical protein VFW03_20440 [Gemmatimonadaceae bacterium]|nr:hypothetical protein [Gemmatimonadaceae bacterium]
MRLFLLLLTAVVLVALPRGARAQDRDVRFAITHVGDTTVTFQAGKMTWVVRSPRAIVVDPRRRDALVAQLKVLSIGANGEATALVTAQAGRITTDHVVIGTEPRSRWYKSPLMWMGAAFGLVVGFSLGKI